MLICFEYQAVQSYICFSAGGKKGGKKKKGKTLELSAFLSSSDAPVLLPRKTDWAEESEELTGNGKGASINYHVFGMIRATNNGVQPIVDLKLAVEQGKFKILFIYFLETRQLLYARY